MTRFKTSYMPMGTRACFASHREREAFGLLPYQVLAKQLRVNDRKFLDAGYDEDIKAMEPRLEFKTEAFQAILDDTAKVDARAKKIKPEELIDRRYLDEIEKNGFFDKLWAGK